MEKLIDSLQDSEFHIYIYMERCNFDNFEKFGCKYELINYISRELCNFDKFLNECLIISDNEDVLMKQFKKYLYCARVCHEFSSQRILRFMNGKISLKKLCSFAKQIKYTYNITMLWNCDELEYFGIEDIIVNMEDEQSLKNFLEYQGIKPEIKTWAIDKILPSVKTILARKDIDRMLRLPEESKSAANYKALEKFLLL